VTIQPLARLFALIGLAAGLACGPAAAAPFSLVVLGDSLSAGLGLPAAEAFPARLEAALKAGGRDVAVTNAGVSGDTASDGLARLDWSVPAGTGAVLVELGANDALRGVPPGVTRAALDGILARLAERRIPALLAGMIAPPNLGPDYAAAFNPIYADIAKAHGAALYPFFLDGVAADPALNQEDHMHPNAAGVDEIVKRILPAVEMLIDRAGKAA
jgi:acyl-CoA thioesterase-1